MQVEGEHAARPMLSALDAGVAESPGSGFFTLARDLGRLEGDTREAEHQFWEDECRAVYAEWQREFLT